MNPIRYIDENQEQLLNTFRKLHEVAEPSWQEKKTSAFIIKYLQIAGLAVKTFPDHFGFIAEIRGKTTKVVALRADLDALVQEVNGIVKPNHSCGHDAHCTMVLYTALAIAKSGLIPNHTLRFIFQPAEEKGEGAIQMEKDGVLENVGYLFGIHLRPEFEVPYMKASPIIVHGSVAKIYGTINGKQAHASRPNAGINSIEVAADLIHHLKKIEITTTIPYSVKMTQLNTKNEAANIIPETVDFTLDVRAQTNEFMSELQKRIQEIMFELMNKTHASIQWGVAELVPAAKRHRGAILIAENAIKQIIGPENIQTECVSYGAEDFHFYTELKPDLAATMIGLGCGLTPGLHDPNMKFNLKALIYGTKILIKTMMLAVEE